MRPTIYRLAVIPSVIVLACSAWGCAVSQRDRLASGEEGFADMTAALKSSTPQLRAAAAEGLGKSAQAKALPLLVPVLRADPDPSVRRRAAEALGRLRDIQALWPLMQTAAKDHDPKVRDAAAEAVTWLGPRPESRMSCAFRRALLERLPSLKLRDVELSDAMQFLADASSCGFHARLGSVPRDVRVTVEASGVTVAEGWCRALVDTGKPIGFVIYTPIEVGTVADLVGYVNALKRADAAAKAQRAAALKDPKARIVLQKLQRPIGPIRWDTTFQQLLERVRAVTGLNIYFNRRGVDRTPGQDWNLRWGAAKGAGLEAFFEDYSRSKSWGPRTPLECFVWRGMVIVSTRGMIEGWLERQKKRPRPRPADPPDRTAREGLAQVWPKVQFDGIPLADVFQYAEELSGVPLVVDWDALQKANVARTTPITMKLRDVSLEQCLSLVLLDATGDDALDYRIENGKIHIFVMRASTRPERIR